MSLENSNSFKKKTLFCLCSSYFSGKKNGIKYALCILLVLLVFHSENQFSKILNKQALNLFFAENDHLVLYWVVGQLSWAYLRENVHKCI